MIMSTVSVYADVSDRTTEALRIPCGHDIAYWTNSSDLSGQELADEHLNATPNLVANGAYGVDALAGWVV